MEKLRCINRKDDRYTEIVRDPETGEVIHHCDEKLSDHTGHGSDKNRGRQEADSNQGQREGK